MAGVFGFMHKFSDGMIPLPVLPAALCDGLPEEPALKKQRPSQASYMYDIMW